MDLRAHVAGVGWVTIDEAEELDRVAQQRGQERISILDWGWGWVDKDNHMRVKTEDDIIFHGSLGESYYEFNGQPYRTGYEAKAALKKYNDHVVDVTIGVEKEPMDHLGARQNGKSIVDQYIHGVESDGGPSAYFDFPAGAVTLNDLIEHKGMNFHLGNIFKACWRWGTKKGVSKAYDARKIIYSGCRLLMMEVGVGELRKTLQDMLDDPQFKEREK